LRLDSPVVMSARRKGSVIRRGFVISEERDRSQRLMGRGV
jgi:hypothetical protein